MEENNLPQPRRVIGLEQKREEITLILTECYSRDLIDLDEYERRIELVHRAKTLDALEPLVGDVPADVFRLAKNKTPVSAGSAETAQITVHAGARRIEDQRLAVRELNLKATGGIVKLYYTSLADLPEEMVINAALTGSIVKIYVPPEVEVSEELDSRLSVVKYKRGWLHRRVPKRVRLRIIGNVSGSVVKIRTRRRRF